MFDNYKNYFYGWYTLWIGHLAVYGPVAVMWLPSYAGGVAAEAYGWTWWWAEMWAGGEFIAVCVFFLIQGILVGYQPLTEIYRANWVSMVVFLSV